MRSNKGIKKQVDDGEAISSDLEIKKQVNPISLTIILLSLAIGIILIYFDITHWSIIAAGGMVMLIIAASIRIADQWEKAVVLRMGKFLGLRGPGIFLIIPIIDRIEFML